MMSSMRVTAEAHWTLPSEATVTDSIDAVQAGVDLVNSLLKVLQTRNAGS